MKTDQDRLSPAFLKKVDEVLISGVVWAKEETPNDSCELAIIPNNKKSGTFHIRNTNELIQ